MTRTMKYRYLILLILVLLGISAILIFSLYQDVKSKAIKNHNITQKTHAMLAAKGIITYFDEQISQLSILAKSPEIIRLSDTGKNTMKNYLFLNSGAILGISRIDNQGKIIFTLPLKKEYLGQDISSQKHFQTTKMTGKPSISNVISLIQGYRAVIIHVPVFKDERFDGVLGISISFENISKNYLDVIRVGQTGYAWMISQDGTELYCPVPGHVGNHVSVTCKGYPDLLAITAEMMAGKEGIANYTYNRVRVNVKEMVRKHAVYMPVHLANTHWSIIVATPEDEILAGIEDFINRLTFLIVFLFALTMVFSYTGFKAWGIVREEEKRKLVEEQLEQSEQKYRGIFENAQEGIFRSAPEGRIILANHAMAWMFGYESPEELMNGSTDAAHLRYVDPRERIKIQEMIETQGIVRGYHIQLFRKDQSAIWVSMTMTTIYGKEGEILYYEGIAEDITERKQAEEKLQTTLESLRKALNTTIQVMVSAVESRDPYTAGHQTRSADLARAIAAEMGLPPEKIEVIRMAGSIHDIGKLSIPAEILSKPTKLGNIEFALIKEHAQKGYEMLKDVESPWPLAEIVYQHHERIDGSGYPRNLKGDEILMEARILAVADVVEAMASHRPYRPGLGIDEALNEIEKKRGTHYDNAVADACLRLFREKGFQLREASF